MKRKVGWLLGLAILLLGRPSAMAEGIGAVPLVAPNLLAPFHGSLQLPFGMPLDKKIRSLSLSTLATFRVYPLTAIQDVRLADYENLRLTFQVPGRCGGNYWCDYSFGIDEQMSGFLDNFIEGYHTAFTFPEGDRPTLPEDKYAFHFRSNGVKLVGRGDAGPSLIDPMFRVGRKLGGTEVVGAVSLPAMRRTDTVFGRTFGLGLMLQWRNIDKRIPLFGIGVSGGIGGNGKVDLAWHPQAALTLRPGKLFRRDQLLSFRVQGRPTRGNLSRPFNDLGAVFVWEVQTRPGSSRRLRLTEDLENAQDFTLGIAW